MSDTPSTSQWQRLRARWSYAWGQSLCHFGYRTAERSFYEGGIRSYTHALHLWPAYAAAYYRRGLIQGRELNDYPAAVADLSAAIALQPDWPEPYLQRGLFHRFNAQATPALADLQRYLELGGDPYWRGEAERHISMLQAELVEALA